MMILNGVEVRTDFTPPRGLLAMSGSTVGCHNGGERWVTLASSERCC